MTSAAAGARMATMVAVAAIGIAADAHQFEFVPPTGYGGKGGAPTATLAERGAPALTSLPFVTVEPLIRIDPSYPEAARSSVKVIGAYRIGERAGIHLVGAWARGAYLPVNLRFDDGRCFALTAEYAGPTLSNAALHRIGCDAQPAVVEAPPPTPPAGRALRLIGVAWGFAAWSDNRAGLTSITAPFAKTWQPLVTARLPVTAIMAMNSPDAPIADMTLLTRIHGHPTLVTLEVIYG